MWVESLIHKSVHPYASSSAKYDQQKHLPENTPQLTKKANFWTLLLPVLQLVH